MVTHQYPLTKKLCPLERRAKNDGFFKAGMRNRTTTAIKRHFYETEHRASATRYLCLSAGTNGPHTPRSEEHTSDLQSLMRLSYAVFCLKKNNQQTIHIPHTRDTHHNN